MWHFQNYCKASDKTVECEVCKCYLHASCSKLWEKYLETVEADLIVWDVETPNQSVSIAIVKSGIDIKQGNVASMNCGFIINVNTFQMIKLWKIRTAAGFTLKLKCFTSQTCILILSAEKLYGLSF